MINILIMKMPLESLEIFLSAQDGSSFREIAAAHQISQGSVTNKLRELEKCFAVPLFALEGKRKVLTPFGREIAVLANENLNRLGRELVEAERRHAEGSRAPIRVGCRAEVFAFVLKTLPAGPAYELVPMKGAAVAGATLRGEVDIGFTSQTPDSLQLLAKPAFRSRAVLAAHRSLAKGSPLRWQNKQFLKSAPALAYDSEGHLLSTLCGKLGISFGDLRVRAVAGSWSALADLVGLKQGYAVLPSYIPTGPEVERVALPAELGLEEDFSLLMRAAYRDIPVFRAIREAKWATPAGRA